MYLGIGSGEALNEVPVGDDWPSPPDQVARMDEALDIIDRLWRGETITQDDGFFRCKDLRLHTLSERRPPIWVSAFGPQAAKVAARRGDGFWTLADPERVPELLDVYRGECDDLGKAPGEIVLHTGFSWAADEDTALESVRVWKGAQPDDVYREDIHVPAKVYEHGEETTSDQDMKEGFIVSADPAEHAERIREIEAMGATIVVLQNNSGADPHAAIKVYGEQVLPALRGARVG
jgi:coenzyme F420-dependent glucose-6-phosphate dehydrogenase